MESGTQKAKRKVVIKKTETHNWNCGKRNGKANR